MFKKTYFVLVMLALSASVTQAVTVDLVPVGNPGNVADQDYGEGQFGAVAYNYQIGKYEVTAGQYADFLNAVASSDPYSLYSTSMDSSSYGCQITRNGTSGSFTYDFSGRPSGNESDWTNRPVNYVSWGDAARFVNWLENGQPTGTLTGNPTLDAGLTEDGAYYLNGAASDSALLAVTRKANATWVIPTEDEWYKAAYHKNDGVTGNYWGYLTGANDVPNNGNPEGDTGNSVNSNDGDYTIGAPYYRTPVGYFSLSDSPYGTFDQGGNVGEWNEIVIPTAEAPNSERGLRGGAFGDDPSCSHADARSHADPWTFEHQHIGFRVASIPEPSTLVLLAIGAVSLLGCAWRRRKRAA